MADEKKHHHHHHHHTKQRSSVQIELELTQLQLKNAIKKQEQFKKALIIVHRHNKKLSEIVNKLVHRLKQKKEKEKKKVASSSSSKSNNKGNNNKEKEGKKEIIEKEEESKDHHTTYGTSRNAPPGLSRPSESRCLPDDSDRSRRPKSLTPATRKDPPIHPN